MPSSGFPPPAGPPSSVRPPAAPHRPRATRQYRAKQQRTSWYLAFGVLTLTAVAIAAVVVSGNESVDDADVAVTQSTVRVASEPPVPPSSSVVTTTTVVPTTVVPTTVPPTVAPTEPPVTAPPVTQPPVAMVDVADATGTFVVQLPADFQTNVQPITLGQADMSNVSGATNIDQYLAGDFGVVGATVLAGTTAAVGTPASVLSQFDPGDACTLTDFETAVATAKGPAVVLSYDQCGGGPNALVLLAVELPDLQQVLFVAVQAAEPSAGAARSMAIAILESFHPA